MEARIEAWQEWLYSRLVAYEQSGRKGLHPTLQYMQAWDALLEHPHRRYPILHIAGTNGKGSTASFLASILQAAGYRVGLHTSPHLHTFTERMKVNGAPPPAEWVDAFLRRYRASIEALQLSFFEATVGMSLAWFAEAQVDIAVVEVGLGGRWDATNIVEPLLAVITPIGEDHKEILGPTLSAIAGEKAGILKAGRPAVIAPGQPPEAEETFRAVAATRKVPLLWALPEAFHAAGWIETPTRYYRSFRTTESEALYACPLTGDYQTHNLSTVLTAVAWLREAGWNVSEAAFASGVREVTERTGLRGRAEWLYHEGVWYLLDVAHNPPAFVALKQLLRNAPLPLQGLVVGFSREKEIVQALEALGGWEGPVFFTQADTARALPASDLMTLAKHLGYTGKAYPSVDEALRAAQQQCASVLVTGSAFVVAEALRAIPLAAP